MPRISLWHRAVARTVGYDFFISYRQADARAYAAALCHALSARGRVVFLDEVSDDCGAPIPTIVAQACLARSLIVIVTDGVTRSTSVKQEVDGYRRGRMRSLRPWRRLFSRIVPINVDGAQSSLPQDDPVWAGLALHVFAPESRSAVAGAAPSEVLVARLLRVSRFLRAALIFGALVTVALVAIAALLAAGWYELGRVNDEVDRRRALARQLEDQLAIERDSIDLRTRATAHVDDDPMQALRLAERAEARLASPSNRDLMRRALSASLWLNTTIPGCGVADTIGHVALLQCTQPLAPWRVLDVEDGSVHDLAAPAGVAGWLVPDRAGWRIVVLNRSPAHRLRLFDAAGRQLGDEILAYDDHALIRCSEALALVHTVNGERIRWDLLRDERTVVAGAEFPTAAIACRPDGALLIDDDSALERTLYLATADGARVPSSVTALPAPRGFRADSLDEGRWAPGGERALVAGAMHRRVGLWNAEPASFAWLSGGGRTVTAYAWSPSGTALAIADYPAREGLQLPRELPGTVSRYSVDWLAAPLTAELPMMLPAIAFSPDGRYLVALDAAGDLRLFDDRMQAQTIVGRHASANAIWWAGAHVLTSGADTKIWAVSDVRRNAQFISSNHRHYARCGAADPLGRYVAAVVNRDPSSSVVVRDVASGSERVMEGSPHWCNDLMFSRDGRWLLMTDLDGIWIWRVADWDRSHLVQEKPDLLFQPSIVDELEGRVVIRAQNAAGEDVALDVWLDGDKPRPEPSSAPVVPTRERCGRMPTTEMVGWLDAFEGLREVRTCPDNPWEVRSWCRPDACDLEMVPRDVERAAAARSTGLWPSSAFP